MIGVIGRLQIVSILLVLLALACIVLWTIVLGPRWGSMLAAPVVSISLAILILTTLTVTPALTVSMGAIVLSELALAASIAIAVLANDRRRPRRPSGRSVAVWAASFAGAVVWAAVRAISPLVPGAPTMAWAMEGDATNNLHYARVIVADNGILVGRSENPVPVTAASVSLPLSVDSWFPGGASLEPQLVALGSVWTVVLAIGCVVMGLTCASLLSRSSVRLAAIVAGIGSFLPLTWFVGSLPMEFGYFNMPFATATALTAWLVFAASPRSPVVALTALVGCATLLLLTWSPILLIPVALGTVVAVVYRRELRRVRGLRLAALLVFSGVFVYYASALTIPSFFVSTEALGAPGQGYPNSPLALVGLMAVCLVIAGASRSRHSFPLFPGTVALVVSSYAAVAIMLFLSRDLFDVWTSYYVAKVIWLLTVLFIPVTTSMVVATASRLRSTSARTAIVVATAASAVAACAALAPMPSDTGGYVARQPVDRILGGHVWHTGDAAVHVISELARRDEVAILWQSESPDEALINYWAIDAAGGAIDGDDELRAFSYSEYSAFRHTGTHDATAKNALCHMLRDPSRSLVVYTANRDLEAEFAASCTGAVADFRVGETPGIDY